MARSPVCQSEGTEKRTLNDRQMDSSPTPSQPFQGFLRVPQALCSLLSLHRRAPRLPRLSEAVWATAPRGGEPGMLGPLGSAQKSIGFDKRTVRSYSFWQGSVSSPYPPFSVPPAAVEPQSRVGSPSTKGLETCLGLHRDLVLSQELEDSPGASPQEGGPLSPRLCSAGGSPKEDPALLSHPSPLALTPPSRRHGL